MDNVFNDIDRALAEACGLLPQPFSSDLSSALHLAGILEERGFGFTLRDLCPKKLDEDMWRARFVASDGTEYSAKNENPALAVCLAALDALQGVQSDSPAQ